MRGREPLSRRWPYLLGFIIAVYAAQVVSGLLVHGESAQGDMTATFVYTMFAVGISRSWELLGLRGGGPLDLLSQRLGSRNPRSSAGPDGQSAGPDSAPGVA